ncbi:MAG: hypothetical protein RLZZ22_820, partial [Pseudomonadota bacterium]
CIRRYTHDARFPSYLDASERDYCRMLRERPGAESIVTPMAMSNVGRYAVTQARLIPGPGPMGRGFAVIGLDSTMFSALLDRIDTGSEGVITLIDYRLQVVARKPALAGVIGVSLKNPLIQAFIDGDVDVRVARHVSQLDGQPQLGVFRKVEGLPLIVYQGEHDRVWLQDWYGRIWQIGLAALLLMSIAGLLLRGHWAQLALATRLEQDIAQRQRLEDELKASEKKFRTFVEQANDIIYTLDPQGRFQYVSPNWRDRLGADPDSVTGLHYTRLVHPDDWPVWLDSLAEKTAGIEYRVRHADGGWRWHTSSLTSLFDEQQRPGGILGVAHDITSRKQAEQAVQESEQRYRLLAENANDVIWIMELDASLSYVSPAVERVRGFTPEEAMRQSLPEIMTPAAQALLTDYLGRLRAALRDGQPPGTFQAELEYRCQGGSTIWTDVMAYPVTLPDGSVKQILGVTRDISRRKASELALRQARDGAEAANRELQIANAQLSCLATTNMLTGAWNRRHFEQELQRELIQSRRYGEPLSLLMFDIDHFKEVNDRHGHPAGDAVLVGLTRLVQQNLRAADTLARWGGEEFVIMMPHCDAEEAAGLAEKLRALLAVHAFETVGQVTASFGVVQCRLDDSPQTWLKRADLALYQAKADGRNAVRLVG